MGKTCLNRLIGRCENIINGGRCQRDYDITHHPNNYDCRKYHEVNLLELYVVNKIGRNGRHKLEEKTCLGQKDTDQKVL